MRLEAVGPLRQDQLTDRIRPPEVGAQAMAEARHPLLDVVAPSGEAVGDLGSECD